jgi:hypothetical protein
MRKIILITFIFLFVGGLLFYWFQWRPSEIKKECDKIAWEAAKFLDDRSNAYYKDPKPRTVIDKDQYDWKYTQCLHSKGLK